MRARIQGQKSQFFIPFSKTERQVEADPEVHHSLSQMHSAAVVIPLWLEENEGDPAFEASHHVKFFSSC